MPTRTVKSALRESFPRVETDNETRATSIFELVHTDLAGPIEPTDIDGHKYALSFTDDFSIAVFVYFLKIKNNTVSGTEKFIADSSP